MHAFDSLEAVKNMLSALMTRQEPLVKELPPAPGSRAERYAQLLCPELHPLDGPAAALSTAVREVPAGSELAGRVQTLEAEVAMLKEALRRLASALGEPDPVTQESSTVQ